MKHVFKTREVAHIWAQQKQSDGRNPQGNLYFEGKTIFSYGSHFRIASFVDPKTVVLTTRTYSNTTRKHIYMTGYAVNHLNVFQVPEIPYNDGLDRNAHNKNVKWFLDSFPRMQEKAVRSIKHGEYIQQELKNHIKHANNYVNYFKTQIDSSLKSKVKTWQIKSNLNKLFSAQDIKTIKEKMKSDRKRHTIENAEKRIIKEKKQADTLKEWLAGGYAYGMPVSPVYLRVKDENIETSRGASIPLLSARELWDKLTRKEPIHGMTLGNYTVTSFDGVTLIVGCHKIPAVEIYKMAKVLNWLGNEVTK